jgi:isopentenyldiphosphate isomerase
LDGFDGQITIDEDEVQEVQWKSLETLREEVEASPDSFTQWFRDEIASLQWFAGCQNLATHVEADQTGKARTWSNLAVPSGMQS